MLNLDEIGDYRDLLKNFFVQKKLEFPLYSYKMMGQKLGLETSQMFRVLNKVSHLPAQSIPLSKKLLGLKGRDGELFEILVAASRTKSKAKKDKLYKMALALQDVSLRKLNSNELMFLSRWWIPVVRSIIEINGGRADVNTLVKQISPAVSKEQVEEAIRVLKELGLIVPLASERFSVATANFTSAGTSKVTAIRSYQNQLLTLAQNALVNIPPAERNVSSVLACVDEECFEDLIEMTQEFRRQVQKRVADVNSPKKVVQFVFSLYPVADISEKNNDTESPDKKEKIK